VLWDQRVASLQAAVPVNYHPLAWRVWSQTSIDTLKVAAPSSMPTIELDGYTKVTALYGAGSADICGDDRDLDAIPARC
jgi:hypothetical protein